MCVHWEFGGRDDRAIATFFVLEEAQAFVKACHAYNLTLAALYSEGMPHRKAFDAKVAWDLAHPAYPHVDRPHSYPIYEVPFH